MSRTCDPASYKFIPVKVEEVDIYTGIYKILAVIRPNWSEGNIKFKVFTDGITNKLVACQLDVENNDNIVLVRIYGNKTDLLIDRNAEVRNISVLNKVGLAPKIYAVFENGLSYEYYPGVTLNTETVANGKIFRLVAQQMARMHKVLLDDEIPKEPMLWDKIEQFLSLIPEKYKDASKHSRFTNSFGSITRLRIEFERLKTHLIKTESSIVFAHNDLLLGNVIYDENKGRVSFIDYEYAAYNYQAFDIANHFNEFVGLSVENMDYDRYPSKDFQINWIRIYLAEFLNTSMPSPVEIEKIYKDVQRLSLASHFMWGIWSLVQLELSDIDFDFGRFYFRYDRNNAALSIAGRVELSDDAVPHKEYAEMRLNRYYEEKRTVFKELL